jgi:hypothetical protein
MPTKTNPPKQPAKSAPTKPLPISAKTGRIVTQEYAKSHPATTVVLQVPKRSRG